MSLRKLLSVICLSGLLVISSLISSLGAEKIEVEVWGRAGTAVKGPTLYNWGYGAAMEKFAELHPDIKVKWDVQVAGAGVTPKDMTKLMIATAAGAGPDITSLNRFMTGEWAARGSIQPLDEFFDKSSYLYDKRNYYPGAWVASFYKDKIYSVPDNGDAVGFWSVYYNKKLFRESGLDPDSPPKSWDEQIECIKKLTRFDDKGRIVQLGYRPYPDWGGETQNIIRNLKLEYPFTSEDGKTATLNAPHVLKVLEFIKNYIDAEGGMDKASRFLSGVQPGGLDPFINNKAGMYGMGEWFLADIVQYAPELDFGVTFYPSPDGENFGVWSAGWGWAMPTMAKHPKEAATVLEFLGSREFVESFIGGVQNFGEEMKRFVIPPGATYFVYSDIAERLFFPQLRESAPNIYEGLQWFLEAKDKVPSTSLESQIGGTQIWDSITRTVETMLYEGTSPKKMLDEENTKVQKVLDDFYKK